MCGRYTMLADELEILEEFGVNREIKNFQPSYNVAPGQNVLVIIHDGQGKRAGYLRWGLVPSWAKDEKIGYKMINARSESAHEKPSFKKLMSRKRCLVLADSFYEWKRNEDGSKQPKRIHLKNRKLFAFAGLWDKWSNDKGDLFTCTILTRDSNPYMQDIHHREPIILPKDKEDDWIVPEQMEPAMAREFLYQLEPLDFTAYNVSSHVNAAKNNDEACIVPLVE